MIRRKTAYSLASLAVCALIILLLCYSDTSIDAVRGALRFSAETVVPALFAFSVLSSFLVSVGLPRFVTELIPLHRLLGLPTCAAPALFCGLIGGFPVGAMAACSLYDCGRITKNEAALLCAVTSNVSAAYLVGAVGSMFGSRLFGAVLWAAQSIVGIAFGVIFRGHGDENRTDSESINPRISAAFCEAVSKSSLACVAVTGYIVFFRVIAAIFSAVFPQIGGVLALTFEFSSGTSFSAKLGSTAACGFTVGFGGLSALMQVYNRTSESGVPVLPTLAVKAVSAGVLTAVGWAARAMTYPPYGEAVFAAVSSPETTCALIAAAGITGALVHKKYFSRGS